MPVSNYGIKDNSAFTMAIEARADQKLYDDIQSAIRAMLAQLQDILNEINLIKSPLSEKIDTSEYCQPLRKKIVESLTTLITQLKTPVPIVPYDFSTTLQFLIMDISSLEENLRSNELLSKEENLIHLSKTTDLVSKRDALNKLRKKTGNEQEREKAEKFIKDKIDDEFRKNPSAAYLKALILLHKGRNTDILNNKEIVHLKECLQDSLKMNKVSDQISTAKIEQLENFATWFRTRDSVENLTKLDILKQALGEAEFESWVSAWSFITFGNRVARFEDVTNLNTQQDTKNESEQKSVRVAVFDPDTLFSRQHFLITNSINAITAWIVNQIYALYIEECKKANYVPMTKRELEIFAGLDSGEKSDLIQKYHVESFTKLQHTASIEKKLVRTFYQTSPMARFLFDFRIRLNCQLNQLSYYSDNTQKLADFIFAERAELQKDFNTYGGEIAFLSELLSALTINEHSLVVGAPKKGIPYLLQQLGLSSITPAILTSNNDFSGSTTAITRQLAEYKPDRNDSKTIGNTGLSNPISVTPAVLTPEQSVSPIEPPPFHMTIFSPTPKDHTQSTKSNETKSNDQKNPQDDPEGRKVAAFNKQLNAWKAEYGGNSNNGESGRRHHETTCFARNPADGKMSKVCININVVKERYLGRLSEKIEEKGGTQLLKKTVDDWCETNSTTYFKDKQGKHPYTRQEILGLGIEDASKNPLLISLSSMRIYTVPTMRNK